MPLTIRPDSTEYVTATVTADHDLSEATIEVALPVTGVLPETWITADVVSVAEVSAGKWVATYRVLVGPASGDVALEAGTYDWILRVTDSPEVPVRKVDTVKVVA